MAMTEEELRAPGEEIYKGGGLYETQAALAISLASLHRVLKIELLII